MNKKIKKQKHTRTKRAIEPDEIVETKDFAATVVLKDGKKGFQVDSPAWYQTQMNKFKEGDKVSIYISTRRPKRTLRQNRFYWKYLTMIGEETGERNTESLHKLFSGMFLTEEIKEVLGRQVRIVKSTTTLSKHDFGEYIDKIHAETGIDLPPTADELD